LFICGFGSVGIFSLVAGFVNDKIGLIVLRAIVGLCEHFLLILHLQHSDIVSAVAALSIPSALSLIVHLFPEPKEQGHAIAMFSSGGPIGNSELSSMR
jgi:MFS family permease